MFGYILTFSGQKKKQNSSRYIIKIYIHWCSWMVPITKHEFLRTTSGVFVQISLIHMDAYMDAYGQLLFFFLFLWAILSQYCISYKTYIDGQVLCLPTFCPFPCPVISLPSIRLRPWPLFISQNSKWGRQFWVTEFIGAFTEYINLPHDLSCACNGLYMGDRTIRRTCVDLGKYNASFTFRDILKIQDFIEFVLWNHFENHYLRGNYRTIWFLFY